MGFAGLPCGQSKERRRKDWSAASFQAAAKGGGIGSRDARGLAGVQEAEGTMSEGDSTAAANTRRGSPSSYACGV